VSVLSDASARVRALAADARAAVIATCGDLVRTPSPSGGEEAAARLIAARMRELGLRHVEIDRFGNAIGFVRARASRGTPLLLNAHLDHVDAGDHGDWRHPPFEGVIRDGRLFGRGSTDTKSAVAAQVHAAAILQGLVDDGLPLQRDVVVAAVVQEEVGGLGTAGLLEDGRAFSAAVIGEPSLGQLAHGHRGRVEIEVAFRGRAAHASRPDWGRNPHEALARFVLRLNELVHDDDARFGRSSVAPTLVRVQPTSVNVTPEELVLTLDWRNVPAESPEAVLARVRELAVRELPEGIRAEARLASARLRSWTGLERDIPRVSRAFSTPPDAPLLRAARESLVHGLGHAVDVIPWDFASDGGWLAATGVTCVGYGPGDMPLMHATGESVSLDLLEECTAGYALLALGLDAALGDAP
jgi:putative selenium metabolism hydrolase